MIRFNIRKLLNKLEQYEDRKILLKEVAEKSGCDNGALSRLIHQPQMYPSSKIVDQLIQYFFHEFKKHNEETREEVLIKEVIQDFVSVYPDSEDYWKFIDEEVKESVNNVPLETLWSMYRNFKSPSRTANYTLNLEQGLADLLMEAGEGDISEGINRILERTASTLRKAEKAADDVKKASLAFKEESAAKQKRK